MVCVLPRQAVTQAPNAMTEDIYTNGSATLGSPSHSNGREVRKIRLVQFEKVTEEPMVRTPKPGGTERGGGAGRAMLVG